MTDRGVVCFAWQDRSTPPEHYLTQAKQVAEAMSECGAAALGWGSDRHSYEFDADRLGEVAERSLQLVRNGLAQSAGISIRRLADEAGRRWGPSLTVAEHLALSARPREMLLDTEPRSSGLPLAGALNLMVGDLRVAAKMVLAVTSSRPAPAADAVEPVTVRRESLPSLLKKEPGLLEDDEVDSGVPTPVALRSDASLPDTRGDSVEGEALLDNAQNSMDRPTISEFPRRASEPDGVPTARLGSEGEPPVEAEDSASDSSPVSASGRRRSRPTPHRADEFEQIEDLPASVGRPAVPYPTPRVSAPPPKPSDPVPGRLSAPPPKPKTSRPPARSRSPRLSEPPPKPRTSAPPPQAAILPAERLAAPPNMQRGSAPPLTGVAPKVVAVDVTDERVSQSPPKPRLSNPPAKPGSVQPGRGGIDRASAPPKPSATPRGELDGADPAENRQSDAGHSDSRPSDEGQKRNSQWPDQADEHAEHVTGESGRRVAALSEAVETAADGERAQALLALAVGLVKADQPREALIECLAALEAARASADAQSEGASMRLIAQLARSNGQPEVADMWAEAAARSAPDASATAEPSDALVAAEPSEATVGAEQPVAATGASAEAASIAAEPEAPSSSETPSNVGAPSNDRAPSSSEAPSTDERHTADAPESSTAGAPPDAPPSVVSATDNKAESSKPKQGKRRGKQRKKKRKR